MSPERFTAWLRERIASAEKRGKTDAAVAATFVSRSAKGLGVRAQRVAENPDGTNVYMLTLRQCRRLLKRADEAIAASKETT
jgi:hypothetical protein